jgi:hypothetical protein
MLYSAAGKKFIGATSAEVGSCSLSMGNRASTSLVLPVKNQCATSAEVDENRC